MPYSGTDPNLIDLQNQINTLVNRIAALDGIGLTNPALALTTVQSNKIAGLQTTVNQTVLLIQQQIQTLQSSVTALQALVNSLTGAP